MSLAIEILQRHDGPVVWGATDCVQFAADAVEHYSGRRPELPKYASEREALRIIAEGGGLSELVTRALGQPINLRDAALGDVVLTAFQDTGPMLGVVSVDPQGRPFILVRAAQGGFIPLRLEFAIQVWSCRAS